MYHSKRSDRVSILNFYLSMVIPIVSTICYLYFFILVSVLSLPLSVILSFIFNNISVLKHFWFLIIRLPDEGASHDFINNLAIIINFIQTAVLLLKTRVISILSDILMLIRAAQICCQFFPHLNYHLIINDIVQTLLILSGNVLENPGPTDCNLKFFHWNLGSLTARDNSKISLIEAYNSVFNYNLIAISDTRLDRSISKEDKQIKGFSGDILRSDHHSDTRNPGGVCLYYKENITIKRRNDFEIHDETVVAKISLRRKKVLLW